MLCQVGRKTSSQSINTARLFLTAFCKNAATSSWYSFNDSCATEMREEEVVTRAAYLLFYQRRSSANDSSRSHDWLSQLQLSTNSSLPRTVTSHSLENLADADKGLCVFLHADDIVDTFTSGWTT